MHFWIIKQKADVIREMVSEDGKLHGCGHHIRGGAAATTFFIVIKRFLEKGNKKGTVRFYGCPEEELLSGKVKMAYYHMFDGCDAAVTCIHPVQTWHMIMHTLLMHPHIFTFMESLLMQHLHRNREEALWMLWN